MENGKINYMHPLNEHAWLKVIIDQIYLFITSVGVIVRSCPLKTLNLFLQLKYVKYFSIMYKLLKTVTTI